MTEQVNPVHAPEDTSSVLRAGATSTGLSRRDRRANLLTRSR